MEDYHFIWFNIDSGKCVDLYRVVRPSLVVNDKYLVEHYQRFDILDNNEIKLIDSYHGVYTGDFTPIGILRIPNDRDPTYTRYNYLWSLAAINPKSLECGASNPDPIVCFCRPIANFIHNFMGN